MVRWLNRWSKHQGWISSAMAQPQTSSRTPVLRTFASASSIGRARTVCCTSATAPGRPSSGLWTRRPRPSSVTCRRTGGPSATATRRRAGIRTDPAFRTTLASQRVDEPVPDRPRRNQSPTTQRRPPRKPGSIARCETVAACFQAFLRSRRTERRLIARPGRASRASSLIRARAAAGPLEARPEPAADAAVRGRARSKLSRVDGPSGKWSQRVRRVARCTSPSASWNG